MYIIIIYIHVRRSTLFFLLQNVSDDDIQCYEHYSRDCYSNPDLFGCHCATRCILRFGADMFSTIGSIDLLCLGAHAQARYTVVCVCVSVSV